MTQEAAEATFTRPLPRLDKQCTLAEENQGSYHLGGALRGHTHAGVAF